jgi:hypothetical protein
LILLMYFVFFSLFFFLRNIIAQNMRCVCVWYYLITKFGMF